MSEPSKDAICPDCCRDKGGMFVCPFCASDSQDNAALVTGFDRIVASGLFDGSHVSLDRDPQGGMTLNIAPDWVEAPALRFLVNLVSELELALALTKDGVRIEEQTSEMVRGVQAVKDILAAEREGGDDDDE